METVSEGHISVGATHPSGHTLALQIDERGGFVGRLTLSGKADSYDYDDRNAVHAVLAEVRFEIGAEAAAVVNWPGLCRKKRHAQCHDVL